MMQNSLLRRLGLEEEEKGQEAEKGIPEVISATTATKTATLPEIVRTHLAEEKEEENLDASCAIKLVTRKSIVLTEEEEAAEEKRVILAAPEGNPDHQERTRANTPVQELRRPWTKRRDRHLQDLKEVRRDQNEENLDL